MKRRLIFTFSLLSVLVAPCMAQDKGNLEKPINQEIIEESEPLVRADYEEEEKEVKKDTVVYPFLSSMAVLLDYGKLVGLVMDTESKYELGAQFDFKNKVILVAEYGIATLTPNGAYQNAQYTSDGSYFRLGLGYKYDMNAKNNFVFTARYGRSEYSDQGVVSIQSPSTLFDPLEESFERPTTTATWYEAVLSSETRMWKGLYLGFHLRLRIMDSYEEREPLDVYSIPGYGRTIDNTIPALNLYVKYAFERF